MAILIYYENENNAPNEYIHTSLLNNYLVNKFPPHKAGEFDSLWSLYQHIYQSSVDS